MHLGNSHLNPAVCWTSTRVGRLLFNRKDLPQNFPNFRSVSFCEPDDDKVISYIILPSRYFIKLYIKKSHLFSIQYHRNEVDIAGRNEGFLLEMSVLMFTFHFVIKNVAINFNQAARARWKNVAPTSWFLIATFCTFIVVAPVFTVSNRKWTVVKGVSFVPEKYIVRLYTLKARANVHAHSLISLLCLFPVNEIKIASRTRESLTDGMSGGSRNGNG